MAYPRSILIYICYFLIGLSSIWCQHSTPLFLDGGLPFLTHYSSETYQAHLQNWCAIQDQKGIIYIGNTGGLLVFDGKNWELFPTPNQTVVRSLAKDSHGRIYYGGKNDFGYLDSDSTGRLRLLSLRDRLPQEIQNIGDVWTIQSSEQSIFFQSTNHLIVIRNPEKLDSSPQEVQAAHIWQAKSQMNALTMIGKEIWFWTQEEGLMRWKDGKASILQGGAFFAQLKIEKVFPFFEDSSRQLIITNHHGVYLRDDSIVTELPWEVSQWLVLKGNFVNDAFFISKDVLGIATSNTGLLFMNKEGELLFRLSEENGLPEERIFDGFMDQQGGLWLSTNNGVSHIEIQTPLVRIGEKSGLRGRVSSAAFGNGDTYFGTDNGIYISQQSGSLSFQKLEGVENNAFSLLFTHNQLLAAFPYLGILKYEDNQFQSIYQNVPTFLVQSRFNENVVFVGGGSRHFGFSVLYHTANGWKRLLTDPFIKDEIRFIVEEGPGILWLGSRSKGFVRVDLPQLRLENEVDFPNSSQKLKVATRRIPEDQQISGFRARPFLINEEVLFATNQGLKSIDSTQDNWKLIPDFRLGEQLADTTVDINRLLQGDQKEVWVFSSASKFNDISKLVPQADGQYQWQDLAIMGRTKDLPIRGGFVHPDKPDELTIFTTEGIIQYREPQIAQDESPYATLIRKVKVMSDSSIFGGSTFANRTLSLKQSLTFEDNEIRFEYSATSYADPGQTKFQTWLEGYDKDWSSWSQESKKDYTNLPEGEYTFHVRSQNLYGVFGEEATFSFTILPPWYRTWWAYLIYSMMGFGFIYLLIIGRGRMLRQKNIALTQIVKERTSEVHAQKDQLAKQAKRLQELDQIKSQFFTNISHELRTPLTVIGGMAEQMEKNPAKWTDQGIPIIKRNTHQLLDLVEQILDLRKLESGKLPLFMVRADIVQYVQYILESFQSLAESKGIFLSFSAQMQDNMMDVDKEKLLRILSNLLSNAIKFSPKGGRVKLRLKQEHTQLMIQIEDSGKGIPRSQIDHIFDRFFQVDDSDTRSGDGTGIGLALVAELTKLLGGNIQVSSQENKGSMFSLSLPITQKAPLDTQNIEDFSPSQVASESVSTQFAAGILPTKDLQLPTLLIVEDNADVIHYMSTFLQDHYHLQIAQNGEDGEQLALQIIPDLIISDIMMPLKNGFDLCHSLKQQEQTSHIPIVLLTAKADVDSRIHGWKSGADAYLPKPFNEQELLAVLEKLLILRKNLQQRYTSLEPIPESSDPILKAEDAFIQKVNQIIWENIEDEDFKVPELCRELGIGRTQLHNKLKALTGRSTSLYVRLIRLKKAKELLVQTDMNVSEVAYAVGYGNPSYFSRIFEEEFGVRPSKVAV